MIMTEIEILNEQIEDLKYQLKELNIKHNNLLLINNALHKSLIDKNHQIVRLQRQLVRTKMFLDIVSKLNKKQGSQ